MAVVVAVTAIPNSAYALGDGSRTLWKNYSNNLCMGVAGGFVGDGAQAKPLRRVERGALDPPVVERDALGLAVFEKELALSGPDRRPERLF